MQHEAVEGVAERAAGDAERELQRALLNGRSAKPGGRIGFAETLATRIAEIVVEVASPDRRCRRAFPRRRGRGRRPQPPSRQRPPSAFATAFISIELAEEPCARIAIRSRAHVWGRIEPVGEPGSPSRAWKRLRSGAPVSSICVAPA